MPAPGKTPARSMATLAIRVEIQRATDETVLPENSQIERWARLALTGSKQKGELAVRIVGEEEGGALNRKWRGGKGPANVLSFPYSPPAGMAMPPLGDIVICAPVLRREAREQDKPLLAHWAHMVVHGTLHLLGYAHEEDAEARRMENLERKILEGLGFPDPYATETQSQKP